jgi:hypothetical protein
MSREWRLPQFRSSWPDDRAREARQIGITESAETSEASARFFQRFMKRFQKGGTGHSQSGASATAPVSKTSPRTDKAPERSGLAALLNRARPVERRLVQSELDLDHVRVVRNDLSDADLQVVAAARPRGGARSAGKAESAPRPADSRLIWNKLTARLFVASRSRLE